ncbi:GNAT family N-acetyltransferase [Nakamurella sp. PAMC28650]|uniref:GNAT family N-acetyltransferase n=1 Tax=Nakamurella sp. PAMC28650 TaxID=2762325 RepID=UPI00164D526C|nr:GNAT family N-acetyltransferase [Nakamurella sp. PAMC28650]QNK80686.1 GNAT family N-acetyltransferase [Nakamurella sp. PAMC28650]
MTEHPLFQRRQAETTGPVDVRRVGPGTSMASDNAFALALLNLWERVSEAGGAVGFTVPVDRSAVGAAVSVVIDDLRSGRAFAFAATRGRDIVGFAMVRPGKQTTAHTGRISQVMVDPGVQRSGAGTRLVQAVIRLAGELGLERIRLGVRDGTGLDGFYRRLGFVEAGRLPAWIRVAPDDDRDEVLMVLEIPRRTEPDRT